MGFGRSIRIEEGNLDHIPDLDSPVVQVPPIVSTLRRQKWLPLTKTFAFAPHRSPSFYTGIPFTKRGHEHRPLNDVHDFRTSFQHLLRIHSRAPQYDQPVPLPCVPPYSAATGAVDPQLVVDTLVSTVVVLILAFALWLDWYWAWLREQAVAGALKCRPSQLLP